MPILKHADRALIDERKIRDYGFNPNHRRGRHKAVALARAAGFSRGDHRDVIEQIRRAILSHEAEPLDPIPYGVRFRVDMVLAGPIGTAHIRTGWIYREGEDVPRLTTLYPL